MAEEIGREAVPEKKLDAVHTDTHRWCRVVGLSAGEIARIMGEDEQIAEAPCRK